MIGLKQLIRGISEQFLCSSPRKTLETLHSFSLSIHGVEMSCNCPCSSATAFSRQNRTGSSGIGLGFREDGKSHGWKLERNRLLQFGRKRLWGQVTVASLEDSRRGSYSPKPFEVLSGGIVAYFEEHDIVTFLDPPKELIPLDPASYNPAAYLWKKIGDIPQERRHRLLFLLKARHITRMWEVAGGRYQDEKLVKQSASSLLSMQNNLTSPEIWNCRTNKGPMPIAWIKDFKKFLFHAKDGKTYGQIDLGGAFLAGIAKSFIPLYFTVEHLKEVMPTEQPCDLAYEFGDGLLDLHDFPYDFPKPERHPWHFDDHLVTYVRYAGPGVMVGQAWQEGKNLEEVPRKFCGEILMVKD